MKYDPETEAKVLATLMELSEGTTDEVHSFMVEQEKVDIEKPVLLRYLNRWKTKKVIAVTYRNGEVVWKGNREIPPWYASGVMSIVKGTINEDMRTALDALDTRLKGQGRITQPTGVWGKYRTMELTFETVDPLLGGWVSDQEGETMIPKNNGGYFIPANWFKGWLGSNAALEDLPQSIRFHVQVMNATLPKFKPLHYRLKVKIGLNKYEAIPPKTQFKVRWSFPLRGCKFKTVEEWCNFIKHIGEYPLRGLGANPYAIGGRVKLVKTKQLA